MNLPYTDQVLQICPCPALGTTMAPTQLGPGSAAEPGDGWAVCDPSQCPCPNSAHLAGAAEWGWLGREALLFPGGP